MIPAQLSSYMTASPQVLQVTLTASVFEDAIFAVGLDLERL